jgi:hypothetical protein
VGRSPDGEISSLDVEIENTVSNNMKSHTWENFVQVFRKANFTKNLLEEHGIRVSIWSDDCGGLAAGQTFIQRVKLFVPDSDRQTAIDILGKGAVDA